MAQEKRIINLTYVVDENNEMDISIDTEGFSGGLDEVLRYMHIAIQTGLQMEDLEG